MTAEEVKRVLIAIGQIQRDVAEIKRATCGGGARAGTSAAAGGEVASDRDLDSEHGNFVVKRDPKNWPGESCAGRRLSECPADFLDMLASLKDWQAGKNDEEGTEEKKKYAGYDRRDAGRCRGWSQRIRNGWKSDKPARAAAGGGGGPKGTADDFGYGGDEDIPFVTCESPWWKP